MGNLTKVFHGISELKNSNYRSTEFLVTILTTIGAAILGAVDILPVEWAVGLAVASTSAYALARGVKKYSEAIVKPGWGTTEWWSLGAVLVADVATALATDLPPEHAGAFASIAAGAYAVSRGMAKKDAVPQEEPV